MARTPNVTSRERRDWLDRFDSGESVEKIATNEARDIRTVKEHLERARMDRDLEAVHRDQLREALSFHQRDMQALLGRIRQLAHVPDVDYRGYMGGQAPDFGLEDLLSSTDLALSIEVGLGPLLSSPRDAPELGLTARVQPSGSLHAITIIRDSNGPQEVHITEEGSRLWNALREHLKKDRLWRHLTDWKKALLEEMQARADLNRGVRNKAEEVFKLPVAWGPKHEGPHLAPSLVWWTRAWLTNHALKVRISDLAKEIKVTDGGRLETSTGDLLTRGIEDADNARVLLVTTIQSMVEFTVTKKAVRTHRDLQTRTRQVHDALEEHLLVHHIAGRCRLCRKLGGH